MSADTNQQRISIDEVYREAKRIANSASFAVLAYIVVLTGISVASDLADPAGESIFLVNIASLIGGFLLLKAMIENSDLAGGGMRRGFGTYFGLSFLSAFAIVLGLLLFVVPGFLVLIRWLPVYGFAMAEGNDLSDAFGKSWDETGPHMIEIGITMLFILAAYGIAIALFIFGTADDGSVPPSFSIAGNLLISFAAVGQTAIGLAWFSALTSDDRKLQNVFA